MKLVLSSLVVLLTVYTVCCFEESEANDPGKGGKGKHYNPHYYYSRAALLEIRCVVKRNIGLVQALVYKKPVNYTGCSFEDYDNNKKINVYGLSKEIHYLLQYWLQTVLHALKKTGHNLKYRKNQHDEPQEDPAKGGYHHGGSHNYGVNIYAILKSIDYQLEYNTKAVTAIVAKQKAAYHDEPENDPSGGGKGYNYIHFPPGYGKYETVDDLIVGINFKLTQSLVIALVQLVKRGGVYGPGLYYH